MIGCKLFTDCKDHDWRSSRRSGRRLGVAVSSKAAPVGRVLSHLPPYKPDINTTRGIQQWAVGGRPALCSLPPGPPPPGVVWSVHRSAVSGVSNRLLTRACLYSLCTALLTRSSLPVPLSLSLSPAHHHDAHISPIVAILISANISAHTPRFISCLIQQDLLP